jgi:hypothetical protein
MNWLWLVIGIAAIATVYYAGHKDGREERELQEWTDGMLKDLEEQKKKGAA